MDARHFVKDYNSLVRKLKTTLPIDQAMSDAVGGEYEKYGAIELDIVLRAGLTRGMKLIDFGCGSGRLAHRLGNSIEIEYLGLDVVQDLLDYARSKTPDHYQYRLNTDLSIPVADASTDMITVFSVFTHLEHTETFEYLRDMQRVLRPGGKIVLSFLEFAEPAHWWIFESTVQAIREGAANHLTQFIERNQIAVWAQHLELTVSEIIDGLQSVSQSGPLGQAVAILVKS